MNISPMKGVMKFGKKGKLSPWYVGPYEIVKWVGKVAYEFELPSELAPVYPYFMSPCSRSVLATSYPY